MAYGKGALQRSNLSSASAPMVVRTTRRVHLSTGRPYRIGLDQKLVKRALKGPPRCLPCAYSLLRPNLEGMLEMFVEIRLSV